MRVRFAVCCLGLGAVAGCELGITSTRNFFYENKLCLDETADCFSFNHQANSAWKDFCLTTGETHSGDYSCGFKTGFADYLRAGGTGEPPSVPPPHYRGCLYHTAEGRQAIDDWFAGFRRGAAVAKASGRRELITVPLAYLTHPASQVIPPSGPPTELGHPQVVGSAVSADRLSDPMRKGWSAEK